VNSPSGLERHSKRPRGASLRPPHALSREHSVRHTESVLTSIATIVGLAGLIISVSLLAWQSRAVAQQTRINNAIASTSVLSNTTSSLRELLSLFVEHPELRPYFYESRKVPVRGHNRVRILTVAEMFADVLEEGLSANSIMPTKRVDEEWPLYCTYLLSVSPALNEVLRQYPDWWRSIRALPSKGNPRIAHGKSWRRKLA
jgi:hypothetical protein